MVENSTFNIPDDLLDNIQQNIEHIIRTFDVPEENKLEVIQQINYMYSRTKYLSMTDELTQLLNRRSFDIDFKKEFVRAQRYSNNLTLAIFDIDFFKKINDTYGHLCGDYVLQEISKAALQTFRQTDSVYRIGGEEFGVILTETDINQSQIPLERFRKTVETLKLIYNNQIIQVSVSIGAGQYTLESDTQDLLTKVDKALYQAKNTGRNKVIYTPNII